MYFYFAGTLAVGVSSVDGESLWESIEHRNENGALWVRVGFGRGSAVASSSWAAGQECAHILRKTTVSIWVLYSIPVCAMVISAIDTPQQQERFDDLNEVPA